MKSKEKKNEWWREEVNEGYKEEGKEKKEKKEDSLNGRM